MPPPREAYYPPKEPRKTDTAKLIAFCDRQVSGTGNPVANAAYLQVIAEVKSGRLA